MARILSEFLRMHTHPFTDSIPMFEEKYVKVLKPFSALELSSSPDGRKIPQKHLNALAKGQWTLGLTISVAMCTFNGSQFLAAQLGSIAAQSRLPDEVVVCDDGSSDRSCEIIENFALRAPFPVRFTVNETNLGSTRNFEQAILLCQGSIIALADQDDIWYRHKLARIEKVFLQSNSTIAAFSDADLIDDNSRLVGLRLWTTVSFNRGEQQQFARGRELGVLIKHPVVTGATMAFRRGLFHPIKPIPAGEIHDQWISFLLAVRGGFEIILEPLMQYRRHAKQQIGPGPVTFRGKMEQAKGRSGKFYFEEIARFHKLHNRIEERKLDFPHAECALREIEKKLSHLKHRAQLPHTKVARIPKVLAEIVNGHYWRYAGGWISVAKDLLIRE